MKQFTIEQNQCIHFFPNTFAKKKHLLIEAGAGAGKTAVLTERTKWLLSNKSLNINPSQLFIVTFSKDAASQIQERVEKELSKIPQLIDAISFIHISTIDSFFSELVNSIYPTWWEAKQKNKDFFAMPPRLQLIDEEVVCNDLKNAIQSYLNTNKFNENQLTLTIDFLLSGALKKGFGKNRGTLDSILKTLCNDTFLASSIEELRIAAKKIHPSTSFLICEFHKLARQEYEKRIIKGEFTYSDRTLFLKENLRQNIPIQLQELIVDEYQDTNHIQHDILYNLVLECKARMVVVGDPKQSIYGFRNASVDVFQNLKTNLEWEHIELKKNFRSNSNLLSEINHLSKIAFQWINPKFPDEFKDSYFYTEAQKKFTPENALEAGKTNEEFINKDIHVHLVTTSINKERFLSEEESLFIIENNINLEKYSIECYVSFLQKYQKDYNLKWCDIVVLCEENNDSLKISNSLIKKNIPVLFTSKNETNLETNLEFLVSISLAKCLLNEDDYFDIYLIMQSPLSFMNHSEIEKYFSSLKNKKHLENEIIDQITAHKKIAQDNFFKGWQLLRWQLVKMHTNINSKNQASLFCARMDLFSYALSSKLDSPTFKEALEKKVKRNLEQINGKETSNNLFPTSLSQWNITSWENTTNEADDFLEVKTVHKAKGLEWKHVCFYPKHGRAKTLGKFVSSLSGRFLDITWLQDDTENLSVVERISNEKFNETDSSYEYKKNGEIKSINYFPDLRNQAEQDYERQRVFYTAFTRAESSLILFQPKRLKREGLRDELAKFTEQDDLTAQKYLEEDIFLNYLDIHFALRGFPKPKKKSAKDTEKKNPPEPWFQSEDLQPKKLVSKNNRVSYYDYGPKFLKNILTSHDKNFATISEEQKTNKETIINMGYFTDKYPLLNDFQTEKTIPIQEEMKRLNPEPENEKNTFQTKYTNLKKAIESRKKTRELISKGILYHAAAENKKASTNSLQYLIESNSIQVFHEFEVWLKVENKNNFINTSRHIIDFLSIIPLKNLLKIPFKSYFSITNKQEYNFIDSLNKLDSSTQVLLVIDYKTGKKDTSHVEQITKYMEITKALSNLEYLYNELNSEINFITLGGICYNKKTESTNTLEYLGHSLTANHFFEKEQVFLFM